MKPSEMYEDAQKRLGPIRPECEYMDILLEWCRNGVLRDGKTFIPITFSNQTREFTGDDLKTVCEEARQWLKSLGWISPTENMREGLIGFSIAVTNMITHGHSDTHRVEVVI